MRRIIFVLFVISLLVLSGCSGITGKGVTTSEKKIDDKISECVKLCNDGSQSEEYFINSCTKILQYGSEEVFNDYLESCKK